MSHYDPMRIADIDFEKFIEIINTRTFNIGDSNYISLEEFENTLKQFDINGRWDSDMVATMLNDLGVISQPLTVHGHNIYTLYKILDNG